MRYWFDTSIEVSADCEQKGTFDWIIRGLKIRFRSRWYMIKLKPSTQTYTSFYTDNYQLYIVESSCYYLKGTFQREFIQIDISIRTNQAMFTWECRSKSKLCFCYHPILSYHNNLSLRFTYRHNSDAFIHLLSSQTT